MKHIKPSGNWLMRWSDECHDYTKEDYEAINPTAHEMYLWNYQLMCTSCAEWLKETTEKFTKEEHKERIEDAGDVIAWNSECRYWAGEPYTVKEFCEIEMHECFIREWNEISEDKL